MPFKNPSIILRILFSSFLFFSIPLFSQTGTITEIEKTVYLMKTGIDSFDKSLQERTAREAKYVYYYKGEPQIISFQKKEKLQKNMDWYYFEQILIYTETNWQDTTSKKTLYTEKTYHHNGSLIAWLTSEDTFVDSNTPAYKSLEKQMDTTAIKLRNEVLMR